MAKIIERKGDNSVHIARNGDTLLFLSLSGEMSDLLKEGANAIKRKINLTAPQARILAYALPTEAEHLNQAKKPN